jgi:hypothetical protein
MPSNTNVWRTKRVSHEGLPLLLRYPENVDFVLHTGSFPFLAVITHELSKVSPNGLPEPEYNDGLLNFDCDVRATLEEGQGGKTVLIETFGGKRKYYIYVTLKIDVDEKIASISERYPLERLSWSVHSDAEWNFIRQYAKEFLGGEAD